MLSRVLPAATCALLVFAGCKQPLESKLIGSWRGRGEEMVGEVRFAIDHTFTEREWDATNSLSDPGDWHVRGDKLVLDFHGDTRPPNARHVEFSMAMHDQNHFTLRQANGVESTFERLK